MKISMAVAAFSVPAGLSIASVPSPPVQRNQLPCFSQLSVSTYPATPWIERLDGRSRINFDFLVKNLSDNAIALHEIDLIARDATGAPLIIKQIDHNGSTPGIAAVEQTDLAPSERTTVFNPFFDFPASLPIARLEYNFTYRSIGAPTQQDLTCTLSVHPILPVPYPFHLPLRGRLLAWDTHDFFSHHRRHSLNDREALETGRTKNSSRFAYDFSVVDRAGSMFKANGLRNQDWYGWNAPVLAAAAGTVVRSKNDQRDQDMANPQYPKAAIEADPWNEFGNSVVIDHGNGIYSVLAHMKQGSVAVHVGEKVRSGQLVGRVGASGAALTVHTHFQLQDSKEFVSEGIPVQFHDFVRLQGSASHQVTADAIDSGEIIRSAGR